MRGLCLCYWPAANPVKIAVRPQVSLTFFSSLSRINFRFHAYCSLKEMWNTILSNHIHYLHSMWCTRHTGFRCQNVLKTMSFTIWEHMEHVIVCVWVRMCLCFQGRTREVWHSRNFLKRSLYFFVHWCEVCVMNVVCILSVLWLDKLSFFRQVAYFR